MTTIRPGEKKDIPAALQLGKEMHEESPIYQQMDYSFQKVQDLLHRHVNEDGLVWLVAEQDGEIIGGILGIISEHYFGKDLMAVDEALFVTKGKRGGSAAFKLIRGFAEIAALRGARRIMLGTTTGVEAEAVGRFYEKLGFERIGGLYNTFLG